MSGGTESALGPHLDGLRRGELCVARCAGCGAAAFPPRTVCGTCGATAAAEWFTATRHGTVWSFAVFHKTYFPAHPAPYTVAVVELDEGPKIISNVVGAEPGTVRVGLPVVAEFETDLDTAAPRVLFRPSPQAGGTR